MHFEREIKSRSLSYNEWLCYGTVWEYKDYVELLAAFLDDHLVILGGDILTFSNENGLENTTCGWFYNGDSFLESNITAQKYLSKLADWANREDLFISFVIKNR